MAKDELKMSGIDQAEHKAEQKADQANMETLSSAVMELDARAAKQEPEGLRTAGSIKTRRLSTQIERLRDKYRAEYAQADAPKAKA